MASSSKSPLAHSREDLSPMDIMVEELVPNEVRLSKGEQNLYPYPKHLKLEELVPNKLKDLVFVGYSAWRQKMLDVIIREGLLGFIDGTFRVPPKMVTTSVNGPKGGKTIHKQRVNEEYVAWKRSDHLVWKWILNRLTKSMRKVLLPYNKTAKELWEAIARNEQMLRMSHYLPLYNAAMKGDWETAHKIIQEEPDAVRARITFDSETALIVAVKMVVEKDFVEKLVEKMSLDDLTICDNGGRTALHKAAGVGNIEAAKLLVEKNQYLLNMETNFKETALSYAAERGDREMVVWLMEITNLYPVELWVEWEYFRILYHLTHKQLYDVALKVLRENRWLAYWGGEEHLKFHALATLAGTPSSFKSGNNFNFLQEFIYSSMTFPTKENEGVEFENTADNHSRGDMEAPLTSNNSGAANGGWAYAVKKKLHAVFLKVNEILFDQLLMIKPIREIREKKLLHVQALDLLQFLCNEVKTEDFSKADRIFRLPLGQDRIFRLPLEQATSLGIHEIVEEILRLYPYAVHLENHTKQTIFQQAIVFHQEKVFNLIHQHDEFTRAIILSKQDRSNNNALHLAGYMAHPKKLNVRAGAALQMQRELQWYKAVERLAPSSNREVRNINGKTPDEVFRDTHKKLVKEGEQWMKDTANSCIIVASLIATVVCAAAIQVPGGNNEKGRPIFFQQTAFIIFGVANSLALFSSIVSVIMFLSIITSPFAEQDFLFALFHGMTIGLGSLFFSILFTMIAFGAILYLMFGENKGWILIPVVAYGCPPVYLSAAKQLPFLKDMWKSMYGMFFQQSKRVLLG